MIFFRLRKPLPTIDLTVDEIAPGSLLDRSATSVANMLDQFRSDEVQIERQIAELNEQLRQTRIAITAFDAAGAILGGGGETPMKKIGRLVPRQVPA